MQSRTEIGLITVEQAAKFLAVSTSTLYGWVYQRRIPFVKVGRALRFELAELQTRRKDHLQRIRQTLHGACKGKQAVLVAR
jgi:excisionase family DNA binding protein